MTKYEWEKELKRNIQRLPNDETERVLDYYNELFEDKAERGMSEQEIIKAFGNPFDVAYKILREYDDNAFERDGESGGGGEDGEQKKSRMKSFKDGCGKFGNNVKNWGERFGSNMKNAFTKFKDDIKDPFGKKRNAEENEDGDETGCETAGSETTEYEDLDEDLDEYFKEMGTEDEKIESPIKIDAVQEKATKKSKGNKGVKVTKGILMFPMSIVIGIMWIVAVSLVITAFGLTIGGMGYTVASFIKMAIPGIGLVYLGASLGIIGIGLVSIPLTLKLLKVCKTVTRVWYFGFKKDKMTEEEN